MKKEIFFIYLTILLVTAKKNCTKHSQKQSKFIDISPMIINGWKAQPGQFPWQVYISSHVACGGALISNQWVLTAAHCCPSRNAYDYMLLLGATKTGAYTDGVMSSASQLIIYPTYDYRSGANDAALLRLQDGIQFSVRIRPIQLPRKGQVLAVGTTVWISGWGLTADWSLGRQASKDLMFTNLYVRPNQDCKNLFNILDTAACVQGEAGRQACHGDSGGPLIQEVNNIWIHVGIVSLGKQCNSGYPSTYTRTESFLDFIYYNTGLIS